MVKYFHGARDNAGGDGANRDCNRCKAPGRSPPTEYQHAVLHRLDDIPAIQSTLSKHRMQNNMVHTEAGKKIQGLFENFPGSEMVISTINLYIGIQQIF